MCESASFADWLQWEDTPEHVLVVKDDSVAHLDPLIELVNYLTSVKSLDFYSWERIIFL